MKRTRKKHNAVIKAKGGGGGGRGDRTIAELASEFGVHPNGIYNWKKQLLDGAASVFEGGGGARACWERGVSKSVVLLTGDRGFESISLHRRVICEPGLRGASQIAEPDDPRGGQMQISPHVAGSGRASRSRSTDRVQAGVRAAEKPGCGSPRDCTSGKISRCRP